MPERWTDDELLAALKGALRARQEVPPDFIEAARSAYTWLSIDSELARVAYDSARDLDTLAGLRSAAAPARALTFTSAQLTVELEASDEALLGQVVPAGPGTVIEIRPPAGAPLPVAVDDAGCFRVSPVPVTPFRLSCRTAAGAELLTGWFSP